MMIGGHGHVKPRPDGAKARCGGPSMCQICARELGEIGLASTRREPPPMPECKPAKQEESVDTKALECRVDELERLVGILTRERDARQPFGPVPASPSITPQYPFIPVMPAVGANPRCQACGIELSPVMGYVCSRGTGCPTGLGGAVCMGGA